jgi:hypothetical protein
MTKTEKTMLPAPPAGVAIDGGVEDGITWATCHAPMYGAVNGYVRLPDDHPWRHLGYDEIDVEAPGGLTYAHDGWIGFDTLHSGDYWPGMPPMGWYCRHWTPEQVADETRTLARLAAHPALPTSEPQ